MADSYSLRNLGIELPRTLRRYIEAQYHIWDTSLVEERRSLLMEEGVISRAPFIEATPAYKLGKRYENLDLPHEVRGVLSTAAGTASTGIPRIPYEHQAKALEAFFRSGPNRGELVISTGTGSGKTESFLMPVVGTLSLERARRPSTYRMPATRAILLYPMNALVNDQVARLRRLLGSREVSRLLRRDDGYCTTFGFYTSRTMYPGEANSARTKREVGDWIKSFFEEYAGVRTKLVEQGKWPAKYIGRFRNNNFTTSRADRELLTRQEMQVRPPDVLITNYSMLEYMLLRPVDAPIFDRTKEWLHAHPDNYFTVVLDEAHLYQGAQGSEVALLLRRLRSRLRVKRDRIRFILTSASLATHTIREFAAQLTGATDDGQAFEIVEGELQCPASRGELSPNEREAFASLDLTALNNAETSLPLARQTIDSLSRALGRGTISAPDSAESLRDMAFSILSETKGHSEASALIMGRPVAFAELARQIFGDHSDSETALDGLLAVLAFARRKADQRVLLPSRAHMLFRGLNGVHACTNAQCPDRRRPANESLLGRLYSEPQLRCRCGHRVFELVTHRECGGAYLRAYYDKDNQNFLWHEPSTGAIYRERHLREVHLLVEHTRDRQHHAEDVWLHTMSGRLVREDPRGASGYLRLKWPPSGGLVLITGREVLTFDKKCPICLGTWREAKRPGIMDLVTKGEDPFAHLIATQVRLQPATFPKTPQSPNAGRKSLLFSDGRQKAARLALDIPRVLGLDAFRQTILCAAEDLARLGKTTNLKTNLYPAFVAAAARFGLSFFDGDHAAQFAHDTSNFLINQGGELAIALADDEPWNPTPPPQFRVELMKLLGSRHYSLYALGLGYVSPTRKALGRLQTRLATHGLTTEDTDAFVTFWIDKLLTDFSLYDRSMVSKAARIRAAGHPISEVGSRSGVSRDQKAFLRRDLGDLNAVEAVLFDLLTGRTGDSSDLRLLDDSQLVLVSAHAGGWFRCNECTYLAPIRWRGRCAWCGGEQVLSVPPGGDSYVKARKEFWRAPVVEALAGRQLPFTLNVQEHTAQLNFRDPLNAKVESTTEEYERRYRDILRSGEKAIDVLSCTTTMEVGIDIGSLIAVGLRNMPPGRHNYQQRAGRAGRRGSSVSTVVTFAQHNPHDSYLFDHPEELIAGPPRPAGLDVNNPTIVKRHANAELIQEYFNSEMIQEAKGSIFATLGKTERFYNGTDEGTLADFNRWLACDDSKDTRARLGEWLPTAIGLSPEECAKKLIETLEGWRETFNAGLPKDEEDLIEFLFAHGVLPAYAFPRDLIALEIEQDSATPETRERPQQNASIALSEYAPGRTVVVNKKKYRIGAVTAATLKNIADRAVPMFSSRSYYLQCATCLNTRDIKEGTEGKECEVCRLSSMEKITVLQPQVVWPEGGVEVDELDDETTFTDTTVAQLPIPSSNERFTSDDPFGTIGRRKFGRLVPLVVVNRGLLIDGDPKGFDVCTKCGFVAKPGESFPPSHDRCYRVHGARSRGCVGLSENVYLGYTFSTDVALLHVPLAAPFASNLLNPIEYTALQAAAHSLSNAIAIVAAAELGIDQRELQCGHRLGAIAGGNAVLDVYVYDTLAGGAGYSQLVGRNFDTIFDATVRRLNECTCQMSCTKCLQTYANRMTHSRLDRHLAIDLAMYAKHGTVPTVADPRHQWDQLQPLASMMRLDGWSILESDEFGAIARKDARQHSIRVFPALLSSSSYGPPKPDFSLSELQLKKDLPSCLLDRPQ